MEEVEIMPPGNWYTSDGEVCNIQSTVELHVEHTGSCLTQQAKKLFLMLEIVNGVEEGQHQTLWRIIEEFNDIFTISE